MQQQRITPEARRKAAVATVIFAAAGIAGAAITLRDITGALLGGSHALFVYHAYFSIRIFSSIIPAARGQRLFDTILALMYVVTPFLLGHPVWFLTANTAMLTTAALKYSFALGRTPYPQTLRRKIIADMLGSLLFVLALMITIAGFSIFAATMTIAVLAAATLYYFHARSLYESVDGS